MKSLRELRTELLGVRLGAASDSIWSIAATLTERADTAINDALRIYEFHQREIYTSVPINIVVCALPKDVDRLISVTVVEPSISFYTPVYDVEVVKTFQTNLIHIHAVNVPEDGYIEIQYDRRVQEVPTDAFVVTPISLSITGVYASATFPKDTWKSPGFLELTVDNTVGREVIYYRTVTHTSWTNIIRGVEGEPRFWPAGSRISAVVPIDPEAVAVIESAAEANMFSYWRAHRAQYDQYTAMAGLAQLTIEEVEGVVAASEARAERRYARVRKAPSPTRVRR